MVEKHGNKKYNNCIASVIQLEQNFTAIKSGFLTVRMERRKMGDLGSDAGQSAMSLTAKFLEMILRLFDSIMRNRAQKPQRELAKQQLKVAKSAEEKKEILEKLNGKVGLVNYNKLKQSGLELRPIGIYMSKENMKELSAICKREGILFSGMTDNTIKNEDGIKTYHIVCKKDDLQRMLRAVDRLTEETIIKKTDVQIEKLKAKGENMTEQDKAEVERLEKQKADIQRSYCDKLNTEMSKTVIDRTVSGDVKENLTLSQALDRDTGRQLDKDVFCIIADANDPSKYIKCHGYQDSYKNIPYIKTEYEVCRDGKTVLKTHDGRFDNRPRDYWQVQKDAMQNAGDFSKTFFKFYSVNEYQKWAEKLKNQNEQELTSMDTSGEKDYSTIVKELEGQLDANGAKMLNGKVVDKTTEKPLSVTKSMKPEEQTTIAETITIGKQIHNYKELIKVDNEISLAQTDVYTTQEGTDARTNAEQHLSQLQEQKKNILEKESQLINERKDINAVQAEQESRSETTREAVHENGTKQDTEHPDDRRQDIADKEDKQGTMDEFMGEIQKEKVRDGVKLNNLKDILVQETEKNLSVKNPISKDTFEK